MAKIKAFPCIKPNSEVVSRVAALPYDVYNRAEAKKEVEREPLTFLKIDRAETQFGDEVDTYAPEVYQRAHDTLWDMVEDGTFEKTEAAYYYVYELVMNGRSQTGLVACASVDDYKNNVIKKHENTRADKEVDRIRHVDTCNAQTGPIFLAYRKNDVVSAVIDRTKQGSPIFDFVSPDGITHRGWGIADAADITAIEEAFDGIDSIYIADGHHRAASAVHVGEKRRQANPDYDGSEEFNYFLSVLFPDEELMIMDYNRVLKDLNGLSEEELVAKIAEKYTIEKSEKRVHPARKGEVGMYLGNRWYRMQVKDAYTSADPVDGLDVAVLQNEVLSPILGIEDPKMDQRIDFIGGIRGLEELERRVHTDAAVAFAMYPTSIQELFAVADAGLLMPPKSTWFEPKLRSGLFIHALDGDC